MRGEQDEEVDVDVDEDSDLGLIGTEGPTTPGTRLEGRANE